MTNFYEYEKIHDFGKRYFKKLDAGENIRKDTKYISTTNCYLMTFLFYLVGAIILSRNNIFGKNFKTIIIRGSEHFHLIQVSIHGEFDRRV